MKIVDLYERVCAEFELISAMKKTQSRSGLFVMDTSRKNVVVLKRLRPYTPEISKAFGFVEEYSIPRGGHLTQREPSISCAVREFIEECGFFFREFLLLHDTFELQWNDPPTATWRYTIHFMIANFKSKVYIKQKYIPSIVEQITRIFQKQKSQSGPVPIKLEPFQAEDLPEYKYGGGHARYECVIPKIFKYKEYKQLVSNRLGLYFNSNYLDFFEKIEYLSRPNNF